MKYKKIRGEKRRIRHIQNWIQQNLQLDMDNLKKQHSDYVKFNVDPWNRLSLINSVYPQPEGIYKQFLIKGLSQIYFAWKAQLDQLEQPYYLKIWLFEKDLKRSQVVCAIGEKLDFYQHTFQYCPENKKIFDSRHYVEVKGILDQCTWLNQIDIQLYESDYVDELKDYASPKDYLETQHWFEEFVLKQHHSIFNINGILYYGVKKDCVWLGDLP